jgi:hypothetical protein
MRLKMCKFPAILGCIFTAVFFYFTCTPPLPVIQKYPEPIWKKYSSFQSYQVKKESARLEALLTAGDTASSASSGITDSTDSAAAKKLSGLEIKRRLFELSIHCANPDCNLDKTLGYVSFLSRNGDPDSLRYLNWGRAIREQKALVRERDSLKTVISDIFQEGKKESRSAEKLKKEIKAYLKQCDSLNSVITNQQETIIKLQKLDVMMEQQRSKIK